MRWLHIASLLLVVTASCRCSGSDEEAAQDPSVASLHAEGEPIEPPFAVEGNLDRLYLIWFDESGTHPATSRDEIPIARRQYVRVDSLTLPPDQRLDPAYVYLADIREAREDGTYPVRRFTRESFEALIDHARTGASAPDVSATADADVIIYGASWCGACRSAASYFRREGIPFVEKDVERDPAARAEMTRKAEAAGIPVGSIPIIDFRGTLMRGFDQARLAQLIRSSARPI